MFKKEKLPALWLLTKMIEHLLTIIAIEIYGLTIEANPIMRSIFKNFGNNAIFAYLFVGLIIYLANKRYGEVKLFKRFLNILIFINIILIIHNTFWLIAFSRL